MGLLDPHWSPFGPQRSLRQRLQLFSVWTQIFASRQSVAAPLADVGDFAGAHAGKPDCYDAVFTANVAAAEGCDWVRSAHDD
jgi:hypothetical protein